MRTLILPFSSILGLVLLSRFVFERLNLYYELWWLDIVMHVVVAFFIGVLLVRFFELQGYKVSIMVTLLSFLALASVWEVYEYFRGVLHPDERIVFIDTVSDYVLGVVGFLAGYYGARK